MPVGCRKREARPSGSRRWPERTSRSSLPTARSWRCSILAIRRPPSSIFWRPKEQTRSGASRNSPPDAFYEYRRASLRHHRKPYRRLHAARPPCGTARAGAGKEIPRHPGAAILQHGTAGRARERRYNSTSPSKATTSVSVQGSSIFQKSIPEACFPTSITARRSRSWRS